MGLQEEHDAYVKSLQIGKEEERKKYPGLFKGLDKNVTSETIIEEAERPIHKALELGAFLTKTGAAYQMHKNLDIIRQRYQQFPFRGGDAPLVDVKATKPDYGGIIQNVYAHSNKGTIRAPRFDLPGTNPVIQPKLQDAFTTEELGFIPPTTFMTTTGGNLFSDEEIASSLATPEFDQTTIDPKGKVEDRSYITEWFNRRRKKDKSRRDSYDFALSLQQPEKSKRGIKEKFAGNLLVQDVEKVAKELNLENEGEGISYRFTPVDVYRYITREETLHENIIKSVTMLNDIVFPGNMQLVDAKIAELEKENIMRPGTQDKARQIFLKELQNFRKTSGETNFAMKQVGVDQDGNPVTVIDWAQLDKATRSGRFQRQWSKGHIKALAKIFSEGLTGADVHTNLFLEPYWSQYITDPTGATELIKGNAANAALQDAPLYVQVLLEGKSWDLKDDFLKSVTPDNILQTHEIEETYLDKGESINLEYQEVAKIMYNKLLSKEGLKNWRIDIDLNKLAKGRNAERLKSYAAAQGIKAYMEAFDRAVTSGIRIESTGQRLSSVNLNDWWLAGKWTGGNIKLKERLERILVREIKKALKEKNVDLIEKPMTEDEMKDLLDETHPDK